MLLYSASKLMPWFSFSYHLYTNDLGSDSVCNPSFTSIWESPGGVVCLSREPNLLRKMGLLCAIYYLPVLSLCSLISQQSPEDLARVPPNSTSNILNRLLVSYDPRIRPNFKGLLSLCTPNPLRSDALKLGSTYRTPCC